MRHEKEACGGMDGHILSDEAGAGQRPMSRRDALMQLVDP
jgi:hypothetical protein